MLISARPAFLEEFTKAEQEMQQLYEQYVLRYRCKMYLEQRFAEVERIETERMQQHLIATRKLVEQLRLEETVPEETGSNEEANHDEGISGIRPNRPRPKQDSEYFEVDNLLACCAATHSRHVIVTVIETF